MDRFHAAARAGRETRSDMMYIGTRSRSAQRPDMLFERVPVSPLRTNGNAGLRVIERDGNGTAFRRRMRVRKGTAAWMRTASLACALVIASGSPSPLEGQEAAAAAAVPEITEAKLTAFATAFLEISTVRDEVNNELGRVHDAQGKAAIRAKLEQRVNEILTSHELDARQYQRLLYYVSAEPEVRERFDRVIESLKPKPNGEANSH
jgi:hypothetical protein